MRGRGIVSALAAVLMVGCGQVSSFPTAPSDSGGTVDVRGTWVQVSLSGDTRTWVLDQSGLQAGGTASFAQADRPSVGALSATGGVVGMVFLGTFRFAEVYEKVDIPSMPSPNSCYVNSDGQLSASGTTMKGSVTETLGCAGVRVSQVTRELVMQRK
jgi:hypothetical protein